MTQRCQGLVRIMGLRNERGLKCTKSLSTSVLNVQNCFDTVSIREKHVAYTSSAARYNVKVVDLCCRQQKVHMWFMVVSETT